MRENTKIMLNENQIPKYWYNIFPVIEKTIGIEVPPSLDPDNNEKMDWKKLAKILPEELAKQELMIGRYKNTKKIKIPEEIREIYKMWRPTPLMRAKKLEKFLKTPAKIYFKREDTSVVGSYKTNSSFVQAYYAKKEGTETMVADTGPGNWGMGMALACKTFGVKSVIFMNKSKYEEKDNKVTIMKLYGSEVYPSPTNKTKIGREILKEMKKCDGSIGIGISEAVETVKTTPKAKLCLGCMSNYAVLHQTIAGMETKKQLAKAGIKPDLMVSVVGGGSNFSGFVFPFIEDKIKGKIDTEFLAVESTDVPSFSKGEYKYEFPDYVGLLPKVKMYTLGRDFIPSSLYAGGLNYHGKGPLLSLLVNNGFIKSKAYPQDKILEAIRIFAQTEGIIPAPESAYAVRAIIDEAINCRKKGLKKNLVFLLSGNGRMDTKTIEKAI